MIFQLPGYACTYVWIYYVKFDFFIQYWNFYCTTCCQGGVVNNINLGMIYVTKGG